MTVRPLTILFMPESAYGPTNQCIGVGDILRRRGHRVVFAAEASWQGRLTALGFEEDLVDLAPPAEESDAETQQDAGQFWKDFIRETAPEFRKPTVDQLATFMQPTWQALIDGARYCEPQLKAIIGRTRPDVIIEDNVIAFPALLTAGVPFVRIVSCNPLEVSGPDVAPPYSGLPCDDRSEWGSFRHEYDRTHRAMWEEFNAWVVEQGAPPLPDLEFIHESRHANLYVFPEETDYTEARPLGPTWHRIDSSVRETDAVYEIPASVADRPEGSALIYLSLGSLGSADVELMKRLVDALGRTSHRYIVSKGPQHAEYELADNMVGAEFLPQTTLIPQVDAVITHGGNNTTTECLHFGKPMIVLPLFWDQHDNAQRMDETGFGVRLRTYDFTDEEMDAALAHVLDPKVRERAVKVGEAVRDRDGLRRAADVIEQVGRTHVEASGS
ncbi:glycosyltransferase [Streptacidiphilus jiangxiensis]|uniref:Glycosyltransferase, MGT family n=1 Tax=Streptacidiphilus jiangxiensis TaxID=235985 RepID=A0A1H7TRV1_STRJI|nr:nucleotide disphospho-sugar-binding domain-containing protein [Streptacidiphilus jiangxiensis]SEL87136.1 glycosyltransferase, MGT family [Streptacidiphilus jiangxiensis]